MPAKGEASLVLEPGGTASTEAVARIAANERRVPVPQPLGAAASLSILDARLDAGATPPHVRIEAVAPGEAAIFVEGGPDWYLPAPVSVPALPGSGATKAFEVTLDGLPKAAHLSGATLRLTLVTPDHAIETLYTLP